MPRVGWPRSAVPSRPGTRRGCGRRRTGSAGCCRHSPPRPGTRRRTSKTSPLRGRIDQARPLVDRLEALAQEVGRRVDALSLDRLRALSRRRRSMIGRPGGPGLIGDRRPRRRSATRAPTAGRPARRRPDRRLPEELVHELDGHRPLADGRRDSLDRAGSHVAGGEHAGPAGLQQERIPAVGPAAVQPQGRSPSGRIPSRPSRSRPGSQSVRGTAPMKLNSAGVWIVRTSPVFLLTSSTELEVAVAVHRRDLGVEEHLDVRACP